MPVAETAPGAASLAASLGIAPGALRLVEQALTHGSWVHEHPEAAVASNERLEFLGDAVLSLVVAEALWHDHPGEPEGMLTARRAAIVSDRALGEIARRAGIGDHLRLGAGADRAGERGRSSVVASALEALVAAVFIDGGLDAARDLVRRLAAQELAAPAAPAALQPAKMRLQQHAWATGDRPPAYRLIETSGPDHARTYVVEVAVAGVVLGRGSGGSRKAAETAAAEVALAAIEPAAIEPAAPEPGTARAPGTVPATAAQP